MSAILRTQPLRTSMCAAPTVARAVCTHSRTYATVPDPTQPTDNQAEIPKPKRNNSLVLFAGGLAVIGGGGYYYYLNQTNQPDPHAQRKADEERVKEKATELRDAGKATAHDAVREGSAKYDETKSSAQDKLAQARAQTSRTVEDARSAVTRQYDNAKETVSEATNKAERAAEEVKRKTQAEAQGWNQWFWSWFGYTQQKSEEVQREGAQKVAEGARKVEKEAERRT